MTASVLRNYHVNEVVWEVRRHNMKPEAGCLDEIKGWIVPLSRLMGMDSVI
jgi:hypothetical protein